ncbi:MAG: Ig-like domain-containing protein [Proteiniphilum sp.]|nr:Ig-like domain-containing protein [Proteiniphilum sp.]
MAASVLLVLCASCIMDHPEAVMPVSIDFEEVDDGMMTLFVGDTAVLRVTILPEGTSDKKVKWSSDNAYVASVEETDEEGVALVIAEHEGDAEIVAATSKRAVSAVCEVTVLPKPTEEPVEGGE